MAQLSIQKSDTPAQITIRIQQDPFDPMAPMICSAQIWAVDGSVLAASAVTLRGLEQDWLSTIVETALDCYRWGAPQSQLVSMMRYQHRKAKAHRKAHGG